MSRLGPPVCSVQSLREFISQRLTAAAEEIFAVVENTIVRYEEEVDRQRRLLEGEWTPEVKLRRTELPQQEEVLPEQQERNSSLDRAEPEPPQIKEEEEEEGEQLTLKQETDSFVWTLTDDDDDDEQSDHNEPEPDVDHQLLSHISAGSESEDQSRRSRVVDSDSTRDKESNPEKRLGQTSSQRHQVRDNQSYRCDTCGNTYVHLYLLKNHQRCHTAEKPCVRIVCKKSFRGKDVLKSHMKSHSGEKGFVRQADLKNHRTTHSGEKLPSCGTCQKSYEPKGDLKSHMRSHMKEKTTRPRDTEQQEEADPVLMKEEEEELTLKEETDILMFTIDYEESDHREPGPEPEPSTQHRPLQALSPSDSPEADQTNSDSLTKKHCFSCDVCGKVFSYPSKLKIHLKSHTSEKPYSCTICQKSFKHKDNLKTHMKTHTGDKPFICKICQKSFALKPYLKTHMRIHTGERPYSCTICLKNFAFPNVLKKHISVIHNGEKQEASLKCDTCGDVFPYPYLLKYHMITHTGEKPYNCKMCQKKFAFLNALKRHIRVIHNGEKQEKTFKCDTCGKAYIYPSLLKYHMRTHTGEKPYFCKICPQKFALLTVLKSHIRQVHCGEKRKQPKPQ